MLSAMISVSAGRDAPDVAGDLEAAGIRVVGAVEQADILRCAIRYAPDLIVCFDPCPEPALFDGITATIAALPRPVAIFTTDQDAEKIARATASGVSLYVVDGYGGHRLRPLLHVAIARFAREQAIRAELDEIRSRFAERRLVDRARGILMGVRGLREEEAYRALRTAAMHAKQRIGQVSRLVIDGAKYAEAINRAGQFRMLSQRLVKLHAASCAGVDAALIAEIRASSVAMIDDNIAALGKSLSAATFGDLLAAVSESWLALKAGLREPPRIDRLPAIDGLAEIFLRRAERLTNNLEIAGLASALHVINVAGRQRMLSQRLAKEALLGDLLDGDAAHGMRVRVAQTASEISEGFAHLDGLAVSSPAIAADLLAAGQDWTRLQDAVADAGTDRGRRRIVDLSEALLANANRLTSSYEAAMQALMY